MMTVKGMNELTVAVMIFTLSFSVVTATGPSYFTAVSATGGEEAVYEEEHDSIKEELGGYSHVELELSEETDVMVEIHEGDLADGEYTLTFKCTDPEISNTFSHNLEVVEGHGQFEHELALAAGTYNGCTLSVGELSVTFDSFTMVEVKETVNEEAEVNDEGSDEEDHEEGSYKNEDGYVRIEKDLGENSAAYFKAEEESARVMVKIEEGDLADGRHDVTFACGLPESTLTFSEKLNVAFGHGEFEAKLTLRPATYSDCTISVGDLSVTLPDFTIAAGQEDEEHEKEHRVKSKIDVKDDGTVRLKIMIKHPGFSSGMYDVMFSCEEPEGLSVVFNDALVIDEYGNGKFRVETSFGPGSYTRCEASIGEESGRMVIASFDPFRVAVEERLHGEDDDQRTIEEKRKERKHAILERLVAGEIHKRHVDAARASSTGNYEPGMAYSITAAGTAESQDEMTVAEVDMEIGVWKSNRAVILMDILGGTVTVGVDTYTVRVGYAVYNIHHDVLGLRALATDDATGEIVSLKIRGGAISEDATFPTADGEAVELQFEGNNDRISNQFGSWELFLDGTIEA